ncbi:heme ABC exporter, ATP-binding protein CcmA [Blastomonas sp. RAC04]|uniref:heme ABC exporter ATP-binding protein CcmA n=1 Tax=Blastomonas sp. RAC04 TaxID=1842535 RepID=UPI00085785B7|nr:heme ABC exporter ATP-binding protein CcmA [Blastomonas sp. RAC04]AOF99039.1 heme ABC exporter, ATP-binding protein CcmA [Blastomonas sp. RAC04]
MAQEAAQTKDFDADAALECTGLACVRGGRVLFRGVSFALKAGEVLHVTGPNGLGKSSLIRVLAGLLPAYAGTVDVTGRMALADERVALDQGQPLARALAHWAQLDGTDTGDIARALLAVDLTHLADVPVRFLSTGQRKRALLARIELSRAPVWLLDEPANGLDTASIERLGTLMAAHRAGGGIVLAASHQPLPLAGAQTLPLAEFVPAIVPEEPA